MKDNLKTWPEKIELKPTTSDGLFYKQLPDYCEANIVCYQEVFNTERIGGYPSVEYIRADIAKEREKKLIKQAFTEGFFKGKCRTEEAIINSIRSNITLSDSVTEDFNGICERAKLEEL
jgi:hypothetical protein